MSDNTQPPTLAHTNGHAAEAKTRNHIASTSVVGSVGKVEFAPASGGATLEIDAAKIPGAENCTGLAMALVAYGALHCIRVAYNNADDKPAAAQAMIDRLLSGKWQPGMPRGKEPEPEPLLVALSEHLGISLEKVETDFLPSYAKKHGMGRIGDAKRKLQMHADIASLVARITADRAKRVAASARGQPKETLSL